MSRVMLVAVVLVTRTSTFIDCATAQVGTSQFKVRSTAPLVPGQERVQLLANAAIQRELELGDDQKADMKTIVDRTQARVRELFGNMQDFLEAMGDEKREKELRAKGEALGKELVAELESVLLPHQLDRLQEILIQMRGIDVLEDPQIAKRLGLTSQQTSSLTSVRTEMAQKLSSGVANSDLKVARDRLAAMRREREEKLLAILNSNQRKQFEAIQGEPFDFEAAGLRSKGVPVQRVPRSATDRSKSSAPP